MHTFIFSFDEMKALLPSGVILGAPLAECPGDLARRVGADAIHNFPNSWAESFAECKPFLPQDGQALIFTKPMPLIKKETLNACLSLHETRGNGCTVLSPDSQKTTEQGDDGVCVCILDAAALQKALNEIKMPVPLSMVVETMARNGEKTESLQDDDLEQFLVIRNAAELALANAVMKKRINQRHMDNGVIIINPDSTYIGAGASIGQGTVIHPNTYIQGNCSIGEFCVIGPDSKIVESTIGDQATVEFSVILESAVGSCAKVGPFAYVRPHSGIGAHCKIGDFVEIKNSVLGDHTKVSHLTYIGDSTVGEHVNFGCGTVTVNYDGHKKSRTIIEDNVFVGCNTNFIAPVVVQKGAFIAAGSTITEDVPENALALARARQVIKADWRQKK